MKDQVDRHTIDTFETAKRGRGRPVTGQAMTNAERQRAYRQRLKSGQVIKLPTVTEMLNTPGEQFQGETQILRQALDQTVQHRNMLLLENRKLKDQINQLKTVTVTENIGQGDQIQDLERRIEAQMQVIFQKDAEYQYLLDNSVLKKSNVTRKQRPDTDN